VAVRAAAMAREEMAVVRGVVETAAALAGVTEAKAMAEAMAVAAMVVVMEAEERAAGSERVATAAAGTAAAGTVEGSPVVAREEMAVA
jgi:hypothetical protein